jgi:hypothetical protein
MVTRLPRRRNTRPSSTIGNPDTTARLLASTLAKSLFQLVDADPELPCPGNQLGNCGARREGLGRNAVDVDARATDHAPFDHSHTVPYAPQVRGEGLAGPSAAHDQDLIRIHQ